MRKYKKKKKKPAEFVSPVLLRTVAFFGTGGRVNIFFYILTFNKCVFDDIQVEISDLELEFCV